MDPTRHKDLRRKLTKETKATLVDVIVRLVGADPALEDIVHACLTKSDPDAVYDDARMRKRADKVFARFESHWGNTDALMAELERLHIEARVARDHGRPRAAASAYAGLLISVAEHFEWQEECEFQWLAEDCAESLEACVRVEADADVLRQMTESLGKVLAIELLGGGFGLDELVGESFTTYATEEHRRAWLGRVCEQFDRLEDCAAKPLDYCRHALRRWAATLLPNDDPLAWVGEPDVIAFDIKASVGRSIMARKRKAYVEACEQMAKLNVHWRDREGAFEAYIAHALDKYGSLSALADEMSKRGWSH